MEDQEKNKEEQVIKIQVPTTDSIASRRSLIPSLFALVIVFFFFNFFTISCSEQKVVSVTGIDLVTGAEIKGPQMFPGQKSKAEEIPSSIWAIIALGAAIGGLGAFLIKEKRESLIGAGAGAAGTASLLILQFVVKNEIEKRVEGAPIQVDFQFAYWGALVAFAVAGYISYLRLTKKTIITKVDSSATTTPNSDKSTLPSVTTTSAPSNFDASRWLNKNRKVLTIVLGGAAILFSGYYFFLHHDPSKDGQSIAKAYCEYDKDKTKKQIEVLKNFIAKFDSHKFTSRHIAQTTLDSLLTTADSSSAKKVEKINADYIKYKEMYVIDKEKIEKFEYAFNAQKEFCINEKQTILNELTEQANAKIKGILSLDEQINQILAQKYGSMYRVMTDDNSGLCEYDMETFVKPERNTNEYFPYIVKGDFNGDGIIDYAAKVNIINGDQDFGKIAIIWGHNKDISFEDCGADFVSLFKKNQTVSGIENNPVYIKNDAIECAISESSSWVMYWDGNSFQNVWTSD